MIQEDLANQLDSMMTDLESCIDHNNALLTNLEVYAQQAEEFTSIAHGPALVYFKEHRVKRPPIPKNHDSLRKDEFARKYLKPLSLNAEWSAWEKTILDEVLLERNVSSGAGSNSIDWGIVASKCHSRSGEFVRSAKSCEIQHTHHSETGRPWTGEDDRILNALIQETNGTDWKYIGTTLQRVPADCFSRACTLLNPTLVTLNFSAQDDETLSRLVKERGEGAWSTIAAEMASGHTESQLATRWTKTLRPGIDSGRWNDVLDARLKAAVQIYGDKKWSVIAEHVPGKTDRKCRERYSEKLAPGLKQNQEWEEDEDDILLREVQRIGVGNWSKIKAALPGRTDQMCRYRYKKLMQDFI
jgi:hypothetical protein